ncbi:NAD(+) synthase, partial [Citrobacter sp. AAK_AS5]
MPELRVSSPAFNAGKTLELVREAHGGKAVLATFPELGVSAYSNEDLFFQDALLSRTEEALRAILSGTKALDIIVVVGAPLQI